MTQLPMLSDLAPQRFETPAILRKLTTASRHLAELKGVAASIPHQGIRNRRSNYYINIALNAILTGNAMQGGV